MNTCGSRLLVPIVLIFQLLGSAAEGADRKMVFFSPALNLSSNVKDTLSHSVQVALDTRDNIHVVWADYRCLSSPPYTCAWHLLYSGSRDGAATFSAPTEIANPGGTQAIFGPQIGVSSAGRIGIVWEENISGGWEILFSQSADDGATFSAPIVISNYAGLAVDPQIALDAAGNIDVVWQTQAVFNPNAWNIWLTRSTDGGHHFSSPRKLCSDGEICNWPKVAAERSGTIDVVWAGAACGYCSYDVFLARSTDGGATFSPARNLSNSSDTLFTTPQLTVGERGNINVVWSKGDYFSRLSDVFYAGSLDQGATFVTHNVSRRQGRAYFPMVFSESDGNVDVFWQDDMAGGIFLSRSLQGQSEFSAPVTVANSAGGFNSDAYVQVDRSDNISLVWAEITATGSRIGLTRSTDGGTSFSTGDIFRGASFSYQPEVAADAAGNLIVTWLNSGAGVQDVLFSRGVSIESVSADVEKAPATAFRNVGHRRALMNGLSRLEWALDDGDDRRALAQLDDLLDHVSDCRRVPNQNDWIADCATQRRIQSSLKILRAGLSQLLPGRLDVATRRDRR